MTAQQLWYPDLTQSATEPGSDVSSYCIYNKPEKDLVWLPSYTTGSSTLTDSYDGSSHYFTKTVNNSDMLLTGEKDVWKDDPATNFMRMGADVKQDHSFCMDWGRHNTSAFDTDYERIKLPGVVGFDFQYRWGKTNNYWAYAPIYINKCYLTYCNGDHSSKYYYEAKVTKCSSSGSQRPDSSSTSDNNRTSDTWKAGRFELDADRKNHMHTRGLSLMSIQMSWYHPKTKSASHKTSMDMRCFQLLFESPSGAIPLIHHPKENCYTPGPRRLYFV